jgi:DNA primase
VSFKFKQGVDRFRDLGDDPVGMGMSDDEKEMLCRGLLAEFGVDSVSVNGAELVHSCVLPFGMHANGDRNPSASLNHEKLTYNCYVCGGGGLLWFVGTMRGTTGTEARSWLNDQTGEGPDDQPLHVLLEYFDEVYDKKGKRQAYPPMPHLKDNVLGPYRVIHPYMTEVRRVPERTVVEFNVGWEKASNRIIIPHVWNGTLVGWQSRRLVDDGSSKYKSTPNFPKDQTIYNYQGTRPAIVVESPMSVLSKFHICPIMEATFGASITPSQLRLLQRHSSLTVWMDNDPAGYKATEDIIEACESYLPVMVVPSDWNADPADLTEGEFTRLLDGAIPGSIWSPPTELREYDRDHEEVRNG